MPYAPASHSDPIKNAASWIACKKHSRLPPAADDLQESASSRNLRCLRVSKKLCAPALILVLAILGACSGCESSSNGDEGKLVKVALAGDLVGAEDQLRRGADANVTDSRGTPLLMIAVFKGNTRLVKLLLEYGADVNKQSSTGESALMLAALLGREQLVDLLLESGADVHARNNIQATALMMAVPPPEASRANVRRHVRIVKKLMESGADVNARSKNGGTPLIMAASSGHRNIAAYLLQQGADKTARGNDGMTALDCAKKAHHDHVVDLLR